MIGPAAVAAVRELRRRVASVRRRMQRDDGMTLIELTVGMVLMAVFMAMFTGSILMITRAMNTSQAINEASAQVNTAFLRVEEAARSASYFSDPGPASGSWWVEMRSLDSAGKELCTQLRVTAAGQQLQSRTWTPARPTPTGWITIASGITNGGVLAGADTRPFERITTKGANLYQQLTVTLVPPAGPGVAATKTAFTVTALNSLATSTSSTTCFQERR